MASSGVTGRASLHPVVANCNPPDFSEDCLSLHIGVSSFFRVRRELEMKVSVFGLGYVGSVSGACLARLGHDVIGVDSNAAKVAMIKEGLPPVIEAGLSELLSTVTKQGKLTATDNWREAIAGSDAALVCVGTPSS